MTVCLTVGATILHVTVVLAPSTNSTLTLVGAQITGSATAGIQATGGRATGIGRMGATMAVMAWNKHHVYDGWNSSHWKTTSWDQENERRRDHVESQWFTHALFEALSVDQLINSLHRGEGDTTIFTSLEVDPCESLADTAALSGIIDLRPFRKAEEALFHKFGLKPHVINLQ